VRIGLPQVLLLSAALHLGLLAALCLHFRAHHGPPSLAAAGDSTPTTLIYTVNRESASDRLSGSGNYMPDPNPDGTSAPRYLSSPVPALTSPSPADSFALKNSNAAHVRWPSESVLNPATAARVSSGEGVVFILDVSGSMYEPFVGTTRLALARQALDQRIRALRDGTPFALVVYGERAQRSGPLVRASDVTREAAIAFLNRDYDLGGGTNLPSGFSLATALEVGSIVLATDGDLNMSEADVLGRSRQILGPAGSSPGLTIIAIAPRPTTGDREILENLAARQGGTFLPAHFPGIPGLVNSDQGDSAP
jgi:Mg-chelatase subunit ChlD